MTIHGEWWRTLKMDQELATNREEFQDRAYSPLNIATVWPGCKQLMSHMNSNKQDNPHQSAYKPSHSTETALLSIKNEVPLSLASGKPIFLVLLHISTEFDNVGWLSKLKLNPEKNHIYWFWLIFFSIFLDIFFIQLVSPWAHSEDL